MFTGLIENVGILRNRQRSGDSGALQIETALPLEEINLGDSIAVNGTCLTVDHKHQAEGSVTFHALAETLNRTNLGSVQQGARVNLERALRLSDRLGGHLVSGHIDATAEVQTIGRQGSDYVLRIALPKILAPFIIPKGSITVDGISLTVAQLDDEFFSVHIIPHTWDNTNLAGLCKGDAVNLEGDMIGKFVFRQQNLPATDQSNLTMDDLYSAGF